MKRLTILSSLLFVWAASVSGQEVQPPAPQPTPDISTPPKTEPTNRVAFYLIKKYLKGAPAPASADAVSKSVVNEVGQARSDQQTSAAPEAAASTSVTEKAGIADILAIAIERGAITKASNGGSVTLSTTPYAWLIAFGAPDSNVNWQRYSRLRRLSASSTFSSEDVTKGDFSSFSAGELKYVFYGDRSVRDIANVAAWPSTRQLAAEINAVDADQFRTCTRPLMDELPPNLARNALKSASSAANDTEFESSLDQVFSGYQPTRAAIETLQKCSDSILAQVEVDKRVRSRLNTILADYLKNANKLQLSVAGLFTRDPNISDYYTLKILGDYNPAAGSGAPTATDSTNPSWTANLNGVFDFNKNGTSPTGAALSHKRSHAVELSANSPRFGQRRLDASLSAKGERTKDADAKNLMVGQGKLNVHLNETMTLPIAISYANRETEKVKKGFQFNIGVSALLDKLMSQASSR